jgi:hypothetical protein
MPEELRRRLVDAAEASGKSINAEIVTRLEESLEPEDHADGSRLPTLFRQGTHMHQRRMRRRIAAGGVLVLALASIAVGGLVAGGDGTTAAGPELESEELAPALATALAQNATFAPPTGLQEGDKTVDDEWLKHAAPGDTVPAAAVQQALADWKKVKGRATGGKSDWRPLGPTSALGLPNQFRDRSVYNSATPDFSGRIAHVAIDPDCRANGQCTVWIANANGGVWRTNNALDASPQWQYVSNGFEHNNTASIALDPNDKQNRTLLVGTGEPNACGSGCEAGVGIYKSTNAGNTWVGPLGRDAFHNRAVGSIAVKPGDSNVIFAASGRAIRGLSNVCCGGADALIPGAPHFGLYRSLNGGETWELVHQGAAALCTAATPDAVSLSTTPCSPRGARRVMIDPVDPNTVYVGFFGRGIWRSRSNGAPGTFEQIMAPVTAVPLTAGGGTERPEFDVVKLPNGETRMYVGVGGGAGAFARFRRNDNVRSAPAAAVLASWNDLTTATEDTPGFSSYGYCDGQCAYDNYVYAPAGHLPDSGASPDVVYLLGDNAYNENNWGPNSPFYSGPTGGEPANCDFAPVATKPCGRSNGRGVALSTNAGVSFTDMTDDASDDVYPVQIHPDHHALVVNPQNYKQFFAVGDGGVTRSNGTFVDDSGDCTQPKGYTGTRLTFCQMMLSSIPERLETLNDGLRTLHFYEINVSPHDPDLIVGGTQDNGSWERQSGDTWVNTNVADGGHNNFDIGDPNLRQSAFQQGQLMVSYEPRNQRDMNWIASTLVFFAPYGFEGVPFIGPATNDPTHAGWLWTGREHVFRSTNFGRRPDLTVAQHRESCNVWDGDFDIDEDGVANDGPDDFCDDWKPLGDPTDRGRLTYPAAQCINPTPPPTFIPCVAPFPFGTDRAGGTVAAVEPARDGSTLWAATSAGRIFVSKNANAADPATVVFDRIDDDPTAGTDPPRYPSAIYVDPTDPNHAWITYSGFNAKTPATPGHVFEVRYAPNASTFTVLEDSTGDGAFGDIPAASIVVANDGTIVVGTDYGAVSSSGDGNWAEAGTGLPAVVVSDLVYVPSREVVYAGTHGQGAWELRLK